MTPRKALQQQQPWRKSIYHCVVLTALAYASCTIPAISLVEAKVQSSLSAASAVRSSLPAALDQNNDDVSSSNKRPISNPSRRSGGLAFVPSFLQKRLSSPGPCSWKKDIDIEWSISTGHAITKIRGGSSDSDSESEDESEQYESDEEESSEEEYESEEYDTDSDSEEEEYDSDEEEEEAVTQSSLKSSLLSKSQDPDSEEVAEYDDMLTPPAMQQFAISVGVMMLSNRIDILNEKAVRIARFAFVAYLVTVQLFLLYVRFRAKGIDDRTPITISNPLASLVQNGAMGGAAANGGGNFVVKALADQVLSTQTTVLEYDLKQAKKMNGGLLFPMVLLYFLHFKMKQVQPLLMQTATGFSNLVYSPLFQVYVLGRNLERPFKPPANPMMEAMQGQQEDGTDEEEVEEEGGDAESDEEEEDDESAEEEDDDEASDQEEGSDDESEYDDSDDEE